MKNYDTLCNEVKKQMEELHEYQVSLNMNTVDAFNEWLNVDADHEERQFRIVRGRPIYGYSEDEWNAFKFAWKYVHSLIAKEIKEKIKDVVDDDFVCDTLDEILDSTKVVI